MLSKIKYYPVVQKSKYNHHVVPKDENASKLSTVINNIVTSKTIFSMGGNLLLFTTHCMYCLVCMWAYLSRLLFLICLGVNLTESMGVVIRMVNVGCH